MASVEVKKIIEYCEKYLETDKWHDYCHNGLQVEGAAKVGKFISGVSLSRDLVNYAIKKNVRLIIVHHGIFQSDVPSIPQFKGILRERLKLLLSNNINLLGFHLPLDAHPVIGNNISLLKLFGLKKTDEIDSPGYGAIGYIGEYGEAMKRDDFINLVNDRLETSSYVIPAGPNRIRRVGIVSGGAEGDYAIAAEMGADTFLCGQIKENVVRAIEETKINFINAGHYNTEKLGVQNLGNLIAKKFGIKHEFVDIPCDV